MSHDADTTNGYVKNDDDESTTGMFVPVVDNYIGDQFVPPQRRLAATESKQSSSSNDNDDCCYMDIHNPATSRVIGKVCLSNADDVEAAVEAASMAFTSWSELTIKARAACMLKLHSLISQHATELAQLIVLENGKNMTEALADVAKGNETIEYACSLPQLAAGRKLEVSSGGVGCHDERRPLGVVASIVPFNFPFMVPMWTLPIALVLGNTMILKPSEKVPLTMQRVAHFIRQAGFPPGVFNMIQGTKDAVTAILKHEKVKAVTFVGSSPVASIVSSTCRLLNKRCTALGGAKNHLVALPDCEPQSAASDICVSFAGCAGQRCMAASVLLLVQEGEEVIAKTGRNDTKKQGLLLDELIRKAKAIQPGTGPGQMGPVIDKASYEKIVSYIESAEKDGAQILVDGRSCWQEQHHEKVLQQGGNWIGPTIILHPSRGQKTMCDEIFGPVLSVFMCSSWEQAIEIENASPFGNAASIYTTNGANADWFLERFRAGMLGVNIGIPVPREPFSFGGLYGTRSKFGDLDITGDGGMEFFSNRIKVTSRWPLVSRKRKTVADEGTSSDGNNGASTATSTDQANFAGTM